jgi:uncharacterized repeat protein (TIGR01451 family)
VLLAAVVGVLPGGPSVPVSANRGGGSADGADLAVSKTAGTAEVTAGGRVEYTITVRNDGPAAAEAVSLTDTFRFGTQLIDFLVVSAPAGTTCNTETLTCELGTLAGGATAQFVLAFLVSPQIPAGTTLTNTATATTTNDPDLTNNTATATVVVVADPDAADLVVSKTGGPPAGVAPGGRIEYTVSVRNAGPADAENVSLSDAFSSSMTPGALTLIDFLVVSAPPGTSCSPPVNDQLTCEFGTLPAGTTAEFVLTFLVDPSTSGGTLLTNTAVATSTTNDPDLGNNAASTTTFVRVADLAVTKTAAPVVAAGELLTYTVTATNQGPTPEPVLVVGDQLPAGTTFVQVTPDAQCVLVSAAGQVVCQFGEVAAGESVAATIVVRVDPATAAGTVLTNTAVVEGADDRSDPDPDNNTATAVTTVVAALALTAVSAGDGTALVAPVGEVPDGNGPEAAGQGGPGRKDIPAAEGASGADPGPSVAAGAHTAAGEPVQGLQPDSLDAAVLPDGSALPQTGNRHLGRQLVTAGVCIVAGVILLLARRRRPASSA